MNKLLIALFAVALLAAGCGNKSKTITETTANGTVTTRTVPDVHFAKTKFVLHTGLAFGAFHRYILNPSQAGSFKKGAPGRRKALIKAGAAGLFMVRELKQAQRAALSDDRLRPLADKVGGLVSKVGPLASALKGGSLLPGGITGVAAAVTALGSDSAAAGAPITERTPPSP